jgi:hypothetical protein
MCCDNGSVFVDGGCCPLNQIYEVPGPTPGTWTKKCCNKKVCYNNNTKKTTCCTGDSAVCSIPSQCVPNPTPSPGPSTGNYVCEYLEPGTSGSTPTTKYVDIPGGCYINPEKHPGIDKNSKCLGLGSLSGIKCYSVKEVDGNINYAPATCSKDTISDGTQCSILCPGKSTPGTGGGGPVPPQPLLCPQKDGVGGDICGTLKFNGTTTPYCLNSSDAISHDNLVNNPPDILIAENQPGISACSQYYEVDPKKIKAGDYCLLYKVSSPASTTPANVVMPIPHIDGKQYCPVGYTDSSNGVVSVYSIVPLDNKEEQEHSGTAPVQLTRDDYKGYGMGQETLYMGTHTPGPVFINDRFSKQDTFLFGPNQHGMLVDEETGMIKPPVLMSTKSTVFNPEPGGNQPRLVDCLAVFDEVGINNINLDLDGVSKNKCTANFDCAKYLGAKKDVWAQLGAGNNKHMIPYPSNVDKWTGSFCNFDGDPIGGEMISQYISNKDDDVLTNFTRCNIPQIDQIPIEGEVSGVY